MQCTVTLQLFNILNFITPKINNTCPQSRLYITFFGILTEHMKAIKAFNKPMADLT